MNKKIDAATSGILIVTKYKIDISRNFTFANDSDLGPSFRAPKNFWNWKKLEIIQEKIVNIPNIVSLTLKQKFRHFADRSCPPNRFTMIFLGANNAGTILRISSRKSSSMSESVVRLNIFVLIHSRQVSYKITLYVTLEFSWPILCDNFTRMWH